MTRVMRATTRAKNVVEDGAGDTTIAHHGTTTEGTAITTEAHVTTREGTAAVVSHATTIAVTTTDGTEQ
jgi:hypothetical protein